MSALGPTARARCRASSRAKRGMPGFRAMAWFLYVFPWVNILSIPLALFSEGRPKLLNFTLWAGIAGLLFDLYLVLGMFVLK